MLMLWRGFAMSKVGVLLNLLSWLEPLACLAAIAFMVFRRQTRNFAYLVAFLTVRFISLAILLPLMHFAGHGINKHVAYAAYFYVYFLSYATEAVLGFAIIYSLYRMAMAPLPGLQRLGILMFRWAGLIGCRPGRFRCVRSAHDDKRLHHEVCRSTPANPERSDSLYAAVCMPCQ